MAVSKWFDYNGYMANKLVQVQKADSAAGWDMVKLVKAFADAGFVGAEGAETHFRQYGQYEDVAPNAFFNATEYYRAKAAQVYGKDPKAVTDLDAASVQVAIKDSGMSAWSHYEQYGNTEKVNPSNSFDTEAYMNAKLTALNSVKDGKQYTLTEVYDAFKAAGLSALEHFMLFGGSGDGEVAQKYDPAKPAIPTDFAVPENKKVNGGGSEGQFIELTTKIDNLQGTAGNDVFVGTATTSQNMDAIYGNGGEDTLRLENVTTLPGVIKGVQTFSFENNASALTKDLSGYADLKHVVVKDALNTVTLTVGKGVDVNLAGLTQNSAMSVTFDKADTTAKIGLDNVTDTNTTADLTVVGAALEGLTLHTSGKDSSLDSLVTSGTKISALTFTGDKSLTIKDNALDNSITKIDAESFKGNLDLLVGNGKMNIIGGEGDDTFRLGATLDKDDVIDGGLGANTLSANGAQLKAITATDKHVIKNIQTLALADDTGTTATAIDASLFGEINNVVIADQNSTDAANITFNKLAAAKDGATNMFTFEGDLGATSGNIRFNISGADAPGVLNKAVLVMNGGALTATSSIHLNGVEDVTIDTTDATGKQTFDLKDTALTTLTVKGNQAVDLDNSALNSTLVSTVDARGLTADFNVKLHASAAVGAILYGGSGVNTMEGSVKADVFHAGAKGDTLTGGGGTDVYHGGAGADTFNVDVVAAATSITTNTIHEFQKGASADNLTVSVADIQTLTAVTMLCDGNSAQISNGTTVVVKNISGQTTVASGDTIFALTGKTFADTASVETAIETGGSHQITLGSAAANDDGYLFVYSDGTNAWLAVAHTVGTATTLNASTVVENLVQLAGIDNVAAGDFVAGNFTFAS